MAEIRQKASLNFIYKLVSESIARFSFFFFYLVLTHVLGSESYGLYTKFYSYFSLLLIVTDFGLNWVFARDVNQNPSLFKSYYHKLVRLKLLLISVYIILCFVLIQFIEFNSDDLEFVLVMLGFMATYSLYDTFLYVLIGMDQLKIEGAIKSFNRISSASVGIVIILFFHSLIRAVVSHIIVNIISVVLTMIFIAKNKKSNKEHTTIISLDAVKFFKEALPIAIMTFLIFIYIRIDIVMLDMFGYSTQLIGYYGVIVKLNEMMQILPTMMMAALFPILNKLYHENQEKLKLIIHKSLKLLLLISVTTTISLFLLGHSIIPFIFGKEFGAAVPYGKILFWSFIPFSISNILINLSLIYGKQSNNMIATLISVMINIILNYFTIPKFGAEGAAWSTLVAEILLCVMLVVLSYRYFRIEWKLLDLTRAIVPILLFVSCLLLMSNLYFVLNLALSVVILIGLLFTFRLFSENEKDMFYEMVRLKK